MIPDSHPIFVSQGDAAGIGWEILLGIIEKPLEFGVKPSLVEKLVVIGDLFARDQKKIEKLFSVHPYTNRPENLEMILENESGKRKSRPILLYLADSANYEPGKPSSTLALRSYQAFQKALLLFTETENSSFVTLPVSKEYIMKAGVEFVGHTELLAASFGNKVFMCMYAPALSVLPLTNHIPLSKVSDRIRDVDYPALRQSLLFYQKLFSPKKGFAMSGLNPHAGENGKIGTEEFFIREKIQELTSSGLLLEGPIPADALFTAAVRSRFSLAIVQYHDQGLIPFKALFGAKGLNITLGLPRLRVSPDHGPAYDIAGRGTADPQSVVQSLLFAEKWGKKWTSAYSTL